jgi:ubiquinone/menaquinone biosynthesis C-methylase UbiE
MRTEWDYTNLAQAYMKRPDYAGQAIDRMIATAGVQPGASACDIGAGTGHLTKLLLDRGLKVTAVEPNDAMRALGRQVTEGRNATWVEGTGEHTGQADGAFALVTFGSSFNTTDRQAALNETHRLLASGGWFACMWNHRDLTETLQNEVETIIKDMVSGYGYGTRREDQTEIIEASGLFEAVQPFEGSYVADVPVDDYVEAWRSHATLERQAGSNFKTVIAAIKHKLAGRTVLQVPYTTRGWMARKQG